MNRSIVGHAVRRYLELTSRLSSPKSPGRISSGERVLAPATKCFNCFHDKHQFEPGEPFRRCCRCRAMWPLIEADSHPRVDGGRRPSDEGYIEKSDLARIFNSLPEWACWLVFHREVGFVNGRYRSGSSFKELSRVGGVSYPEEVAFGSEKSIQRAYDRICNSLAGQIEEVRDG